MAGTSPAMTERLFVISPPCGEYEKKREAPYFTPSFFCRLDDEVVYWKMSFLSG